MLDHSWKLGDEASGFLPSSPTFHDFFSSKRPQQKARCNPHQGDTFGHNALLPICGWGSIDSLRALLEMAPGIKMHRALHVAVFGEGAPAQIIPELLLAGREEVKQ